MRHRWLLPLLLVSASGVKVLQAQSTDSTYIRRVNQYADSIYRRTTSSTIRYRLLPQLRMYADSVLKNRPVVDTIVLHDTIVVHDTATAIVVAPPPVTSTAVIFTHPYAPPSNGAAFAELPRDTVSVVVPTPVRTINVADLQAAYDTAATNDRLLIPKNSITSHLHIRANARAGWVTIQGTDSTSIIQTTIGGSESAVNIESGAHHIRFLGPLLMRAQTDATNAIFRSYNGETQPSQLANHIILDGVTIDAGAFEVRRCAWPDGAYMAIVNSRLLNCASRSGDAQAILIGNGTGPYRFENNYLEGGHQCFMSGGFDESLPAGTLPSDVVFRYNTCFKPLRWHYSLDASGNKQYIGEQRQVKTILETKYIRRALFEYNRFINVWQDAQAGFCGLLKSTNQDGSQPWAQTVDLTFRYNRCENIASGLNLAAHPQGGLAMTRVSVYDNLFKNLEEGDGTGIDLQILNDVVDNVILNNSWSNAGNQAISFDGVAGVRTVVNRNVLYNGAYGVKGSSTGSGTPSITKWIPDGLFEQNLIVGADCSSYPASTTCTLPAPAGIGADTTKVPK